MVCRSGTVRVLDFVRFTHSSFISSTKIKTLTIEQQKNDFITIYYMLRCATKYSLQLNKTMNNHKEKEGKKE